MPNVARVTLMGLVLAGAATARGESWPTYRRDHSRSGVTSERVGPVLAEAWVHRSKQRPRPAWPGPARRDGWHKVDNLKPRVIFDWAFHVVADERRVYFGSSADDKVYCLDAATGKERWSFFTEGPIRLAPTVADGRLYVGSDDGVVYCLNADDGGFLWKHRAAPSDERVPGNGRMMSVWPVRTGVLVDDGVAYFCGGLFPFEGAYLCALRAEDGDVLWKKRLDNLAPQGYLLASPARLYVPTGRGAPFVFDRKTGDFQYALGGSGGAFCVLTEEALVYGPGKTGRLDAFPAGSKDQIASFPGNQMVVTPKLSYLHTDTQLSALDRVRYLGLAGKRRNLAREQARIRRRLKDSKTTAREELGQRLTRLKKETDALTKEMSACMAWERACTYPYSLVLAGDVLFAGGTGTVAALSSTTGETLWSAPVRGRALALAVAGGRLLVSTDTGAIHCFR